MDAIDEILLCINYENVRLHQQLLKNLGWWQFSKKSYRKERIKWVEEEIKEILDRYSLKEGYTPTVSLSYSKMSKMFKHGITYELFTEKVYNLKGIKCLVCGMSNFNPKHIEEKYCIDCEKHHPIKIS